MATIGPDSHNPSARPSLVPLPSDEVTEILEKGKHSRSTSKAIEINSYLDLEIIKQLRRELNEEIIDNEFNIKRRKALEEALKSIPKDRQHCDALLKLQKEMKLPAVSTEIWLNLPRVFSRSSARFELPLDSRSLETMSTLDYVKNHVSVNSSRKLLYNCVFNKLKMEIEVKTDKRVIQGKVLFCFH